MMRLIIDTDAGVDDAQAIMMALAAPGVTVEAITTLSGNIHVDKVVRNVLTVLEVMGAQVPVFRGAESALLNTMPPEEAHVHGDDGMGDWPERPPVRGQVEREHAAQALVRLINQYPGEMTLIALGPLTNLALALKLDPELPAKVQRFVFMGGAINAHGNTMMVTAEWNIFCDPEAAALVIASFPDSAMVSWEATVWNPLSWPVYEELCAASTAAGRMFSGITAKTRDFAEHLVPRLPGYLIPDPLAMAVVLEPNLALESFRHYTVVELTGQYTRGQTVIDYMDRLGQPANVLHVTKLDMDGVANLYRRAIYHNA
ncbi:MAG: nucleoside hydrolase [Anaerolineae bacterium]